MGIQWLKGAIACAGLALSIAATAQSKPVCFSDWCYAVGDDGFTVAETKNQSGHTLGILCTSSNGTCLWYMRIATSCEQDKTYPGLINTELSATPIEVKCATVDQKFTYIFDNFEVIDKLVSGNGIFAVALPIGGTQFAVVRFSLAGSTAATRMARAIAAKGGEKSTKDSRL